MLIDREMGEGDINNRVSSFGNQRERAKGVILEQFKRIFEYEKIVIINHLVDLTKKCKNI